MLVRFTVGNFLSFNKNQTLSLIAGPVQRYKERLYQAEDMRLLKFGALYGANAAGKSNFIRAMEYFRAVLFLGTEKVPNDLYFRLDPSNKEKTSYFEFEICLNGKIYAYGFEMLIASRQITEEWFIELGKDRNRELFTRNTVTKQIIFDNSLIKKDSVERMNVYLTDYKAVQNNLFLANIVTNKEDLYTENPDMQIFKKVYEWFLFLNVSFPETMITGYDCLSKEKSSEMLAALKSFATGISGVVQTEITKEQALDKTSSKIRAEIEEDLQKHCPPDCKKVPSESECKDCGFKMNVNGQLIFVTYKDRKPVFTEVTFEHNNIPGVTFSLAE
ncbi:MAG: AAA family ATPase, partial [Treponema sp.]